MSTTTLVPRTRALDVKPGDRVVSWGLPATVVRVYEDGKLPMMELQLRNGERRFYSRLSPCWSKGKA